MKIIRPVVIIVSGGVILTVILIVLATQKKGRIESAALESYVFKTHLKDDDIRIQSTGAGVVVLTGTVSLWSHQLLAEQAVAGLPGVKRVENKLAIKDGHPAELSDGWIGIQVKTMLLFHRNVNGIKIDVDVNKSVVTLSGQVQSQAEKELAGEYAADVENVKSVNNTLTIKTAEKSATDKVSDYIDDASITAQVKVALMFHRSTSAFKTTVDTKDGVVTVGGTANNKAEKALVSKIVNDIKGVKELKNQMNIG